MCVSHTALQWQRFDTLVPAQECCFWYPQAILRQKHLWHTHLLAYWKRGEDAPWLSNELA